MRQYTLQVLATDTEYFGRFMDELKGALVPFGSELGLGLTLFSLAVATRVRTIVEIGTWKGFSTLALASALRFLDQGWQEPADRYQRPDVDYDALEKDTQPRQLFTIDVESQLEIKDLVVKNGLGEYVVVIRGDSREVDLDFPFDLLFIDGNHEYEVCRADVERYVPKLKPGGYFILHDYYGWYKGGQNGSEVKKVCEELQLEGYPSLLIDTRHQSFVVFRKPYSK